MTDPTEALIREQDDTLARLTAFINGGIRQKLISAESGEAMIATAEKGHDDAVARIRAAGGMTS